MITRGLAAVAAVTLAVLTGLPAGPAGAAAQPHPRSEEWWFVSWGVEKLAWPESTGQGITVAVIDTGVNADLPELRGVVVPGTDVDSQNPGDGRKDTDTAPDHKGRDAGHGTAMAALIAGQGGGAGMVGVAPDAKIMPIVNNMYGHAKAIRYAADHGAQVISISQGNPTSDPRGCDTILQQAIAYATIQKNVVIVAAAGNEGRKGNPVEFPASCAGVLAVGAIDAKPQAWSDTERQPYVAVSAPGYLVGSIDKYGRYMNDISGTSQATALTSAAVALVRAKYPNMSAREVVQRIINTTVPIGGKGHHDQTGYGAVLPSAAMTKNVDKNAPNPPFERLDAWLASHPQQSSSAAPPQRPGSSPAAAKKSTSQPGMIGVLALAVVVVGVIVVILLVRSRRSARRAPAPYPQWQPPQQGGPPSSFHQGGPPQSFGPPRTGPPPVQSYPPEGYPQGPGQPPRPSFLSPPEQGPR
jgi:type VII secretion-associated serine protease mycosin